MKRTATTLVLLAGLGGGCVSPNSQAQRGQQQPTGGFGTVTRGKEIGTVQGPLGEPVMATMPTGSTGVMPAGGVSPLAGKSGYVRPVAGVGPTQVTSNEGCTNCMVPGVGGSVVRAMGPSYGPPPGAYGYDAGGPNGLQNMPNHGIVPVPTMGPPGAVAMGGGAITAMRPPVVNGRSAINFTGPAGMKVTWQLPDASFTDEKNALTAPKEYNFLQGQVYRLRLTQILPDFPGRAFYPTLEVAPANPKTLTFLSHSSVPITFTPDDFSQARAGNLVVKVIYLPDPANQDFSTVVAAEEVVTTRLEPGADPVAEAQRRGTILAIIRMGNIDLENHISPKMTAPPPGAVVPPRGLPLPPGIPAPKSEPKLGLNSPVSPVAPRNPPGISSVKTPVTLPPLPSAVPTDLPPAPLGPIAPLAPKSEE